MPQERETECECPNCGHRYAHGGEVEETPAEETREAKHEEHHGLFMQALHKRKGEHKKNWP